MIFLLLGCIEDDYIEGVTWPPDGAVLADDDDDDDDDDTDAPSDDGIVGEWISTGSDVSELFSNDPLNFVEVVGTFSDDGSYTFDAVDGDGTEWPFEGTYTVDDATDPGTISLSQTVPDTATALGIWSVDGDELTYEVVQTVPDFGFAPPTPGSGFGSTSGPGMTAGMNIQIYVRR